MLHDSGGGFRIDNRFEFLLGSGRACARFFLPFFLSSLVLSLKIILYVRGIAREVVTVDGRQRVT